MKIKRMLFIFLIITVCFLFSGCWDRVEIDRKIFVSTIGIDVGKDIDKQKQLKNINPSEPFGQRDIKRLKLVYGFPDISELGPEKGNSAKEQYISTEAYSMEDGISKSNSISSRTLSFSHARILLLSDRILNYPDVIKEILDYLKRQSVLNRTMPVALVEGDVEEYIKYNPVMEKNIENYLTGIMENPDKDSFSKALNLNNLLISFQRNGEAILPKVIYNKTKNQIALHGLGMIKDYKLIGYLNPIQASDTQIISGKIKRGRKTIYINGHPLDLEIDGVTRKVELQQINGSLIFNIKVNMEGELKQYYLKDNIIKSDNIKNIEGYFNESLSKEFKKVINITQKQYGFDVLELGKYIEKYKPDIWKEVKNNWDNIYKECTININVDTHIKRMGVSK